MTNSIPFSKLLILFLSITVLSFSSCEDDDDVLGMDFNDDGTLFMSSKSSGLVGVIDTRDSDNREIFTFAAAGMDSDGIYFDESGQGLLYQVNRSANTIVQYEDVLDDLNDDEGVNISLTSSSGNFTNGRGLTQIGNEIFIVAQDGNDANDDVNKLAIFQNTNGDAIEFSKSITVPINLWGIQAVRSEGKDLIYAVVDNSDSLAIFDGLLDAADGSTLEPTNYIKVDGIVRTHGLEYWGEDDLMILTDIGDAGSDNDGALIIIRNFSDAASDGTVSASEYTRIAGSSTLLGNPVDVAYDDDGDRVFVAEIANGGGQILAFPLTGNGNIAPVITGSFAGISSLWLNND